MSCRPTPDRKGHSGAFFEALLLTGMSFPALAQQLGAGNTADASAGPQQPVLEEIVVTALKRDTRLQDTPISISAISGQTLENSGVRSIADLTATAPSLNVVDGGPSSRSISIRGIASAGEPTVGLYYDETPVTGLIGSTNDASSATPELRLFDVDRIEVLRGPQGTLYGSGSMGGTLRVIYNKPTFQNEASIETSLSGTDGGGFNHDTSGMINVPLGDEVAVRATGFYRRIDGYIDNVRLGVDNINADENYGGRFLLRAMPTQDLTLDAAAYINRERSDTPSWFPDLGDYRTDAATREPIRDDTNLFSLTGAWRLPSATLTGSLSYMDRNLETATDTSAFIGNYRQPLYCQYLANGGQPCGGAQLGAFYDFVDAQSTSALYAQQHLGAYTGELRLSSTNSQPLNWTVGAFWSHRATDLNNSLLNVDPMSGTLIEPLQVDNQRLVHDLLTQTAAFGEAAWDITHELEFTLGLRYFDYHRAVTGETTQGDILLGSMATPTQTSSFNQGGFVKKFNLSYKVTPDVMLYSEASQGFRPGGVNQSLGLPTQFANYSADRLWDYELGIKTTSFERRLTLDVDAFQIDWSNMQVAATSTNNAFSFIGNAGAARIRGVELEAAVRPLTGLSIQGSGSTMHAVLTEDQVAAGLVAPGVRGERLPGVPSFSGGIAVQYDYPLRGGMSLMTRLDTRYFGNTYSGFDPTAPTTVRMPAYSLTNSRIGLESADQHWGVYLFANNLFNSDVALVNYISPLTFQRTNTISALPRTIGVNIRKAF